VLSHSYQFSWNPKHDWSALYAPSNEIRAYLESSARKYGADRFIKLEHEVTNCRWDGNQGKWHVHVKKPDGSVIEDTSDVLISARGLLNTKKWPSIDGLWDFKGEIMHTSAFDNDYDFKGKRVGVIGSGSSAIQTIPRLQKVAGRLSCFIRGRTWISPPLGQQTQDELGIKSLDFNKDQIENFKDPEALLNFRMKIEADANNIHAITLKGTEMQIGAQALFEQGMRDRLAKKPEYMELLKPTFAPGCRRLTPGAGFLEAMVEDNVDYVKDHIERIQPEGVVTKDGKLHELDVLICATGFYTSSAPPFPIVGVDGKTLQDHWHERATNYLSLATDNFPNHFMMLGPNGAIGEGSLTMMIESTGDYICKAIRKLQKDNLKSMVVKRARVRDFLSYVDSYFRGTVYMDDCQSWYKNNGQGQSGSTITGLLPGSTLHCIEAMRSPRWEDYEYEYLPEENGAKINQMGWLGNGWGAQQLRQPAVRTEDLSFYVLPEFQDPPVEGEPEKKEAFNIRPWSY
jgi:cation diffusion facilitator CzcD-associated flavoprotein CzcO